MAKSHPDTLKMLKQELAFLDGRGYGGRQPWRPVSVFLDSPSCRNRLDTERAFKCADCWLYRYVPERFRQEAAPCHFISLNQDGESVHTMTRQCAPGEVEDALRAWLVGEIARLEALERSGKNDSIDSTN